MSKPQAEFVLGGLSPTYRYPVTVRYPSDDGQPMTKGFTAIFPRMDSSEADEVKRRFNAGELTDLGFCREFLRGWGDEVREAKDAPPLPFTPENLQRMLSETPVPGAIVIAWYLSLKGAPEKN